ncbi:Type 2 DNA topoisomerase 6 subunit B [uncultured archaeon]|nr:Type 2 DNA topoisomerase 6 subunit B [uncultured archaeon]
MAIAEELAKKQKDISVAEFFERNRHLLGFDNKRKALLTVVKEAVDNSLDACEEAKTLPEINIQIVEMGNDRFRISVEDNGPGIVKKQIPNIFAKLLYGSKFHTMKQARGQQGIGISAAVLYAQLTTGRPAKIWSRIEADKPAQYFELHIDTQTNTPEIVKEEETNWKKEHGTKIELDVDATYQKGDQSVDSYLKQTAIANPHATIIYTNPKAEQLIFPRATDKLPKEPIEIKPHPYGIELGIMLKMVKNTDCRTLQSFLTQEFSRVGPQTAKEICDKAGLFTNMKPGELQLPHVEKLVEAIKNTKIIAPSTDCIVPIGEDLLEKGLRKEVAAEFYTAVSRSPDVYKGIPFVIEVALAYGGQQTGEEPIRLLRFANRVPLLYQQGSCAGTKSVVQTNWKPYGLGQSQGALPVGPLTVVVSMVSVWPPFTSEAKEAIAHYPEIVKEMKLALQEAGRRLGSYVNKKRRVSDQQERVNIFENYIPEVADALYRLTGVGKEKIIESMRRMLEKNKEYIAAHKEAHKVEATEKKDKEGQVRLAGFEDE